MRTENYQPSGYRRVRVVNSAGDTEFHALRSARKGFTVTLTPEAPGDTAAEMRIRDAEIRVEDDDTIAVDLPGMPAASTVGAGTVINQNFGTVQNGIQAGIVSNGVSFGSSGSDLHVGGMPISGITQIGGTGEVTVVISAPAGTGLVARNAGDIRHLGAADTIDAETTRGDISVQHVQNELDLTTSYGSIRIGAADCRAYACTSHGHIRAIELRRGGTLRTSQGNVHAHLAADFPLETRASSGDIQLTTADGVSEDNLLWHASGKVLVNGNTRPAQSRN